MANPGLAFVTINQTTGSYSQLFIPDQDMPDYPHSPGYDTYRDDIITPYGNIFQYDKGHSKSWDLSFTDISLATKDFLRHCHDGWLKQKQLTITYYGSLVTGTAIKIAGATTELSYVNQCWGTGFLRLQAKPVETAMDLWNANINIKEFGTNQSFNFTYGLF